MCILDNFPHLAALCVNFPNVIDNITIGMSHVQRFLHRLNRTIQDPKYVGEYVSSPYTKAFGRMTNLG